MVDPNTDEFRERYHRFVELTLDYGTDAEGLLQANALVPIPAELAFELMNLAGDVLSRLAAVGVVVGTLKRLAINGTDRSVMETLERILDPSVDAAEYLSKLERWSARH